MDVIIDVKRHAYDQLLVLEDWRPELDVAVPFAELLRHALDQLPFLDFTGQDVVGSADSGDHR